MVVRFSSSNVRELHQLFPLVVSPQHSDEGLRRGLDALGDVFPVLQLSLFQRLATGEVAAMGQLLATGFAL